MKLLTSFILESIEPKNKADRVFKDGVKVFSNLLIMQHKSRNLHTSWANRKFERAYADWQQIMRTIMREFPGEQGRAMVKGIKVTCSP